MVNHPPIMLTHELAIVEIQGHCPPIDHTEPALLTVGQFERKEFPAFVFIRIEGAAVTEAVLVNSKHGTGQRIVRNFLDGTL